MLFQMQAETNIETLERRPGAKKVIASCPHCLHTLKPRLPAVWRQLRSHSPHPASWQSSCSKTGTLKPGPATASSSVTFHDSCYLGRWNNEFDAPRDILEETADLRRDRECARLPGTGVTGSAAALAADACSWKKTGLARQREPNRRASGHRLMRTRSPSRARSATS